MTTGERIRKARKAKGLTQTALGSILKVSQATVGQYETNPNPPKLETLSRIAEALEVDPVDLIGEPEGDLSPFFAEFPDFKRWLYAVGYNISIKDGSENITLLDADTFQSYDVTADELIEVFHKVVATTQFEINYLIKKKSAAKMEVDHGLDKEKDS